MTFLGVIHFVSARSTKHALLPGGTVRLVKSPVTINILLIYENILNVC